MEVWSSRLFIFCFLLILFLLTPFLSAGLKNVLLLSSVHLMELGMWLLFQRLTLMLQDIASNCIVDRFNSNILQICKLSSSSGEFLDLCWMFFLEVGDSVLNVQLNYGLQYQWTGFFICLDLQHSFGIHSMWHGFTYRGGLFQGSGINWCPALFKIIS